MQEQINVLLIEDNPGDTRLIRELFAEAKAVSACLLCAGRLSSGLKQLAEGGVDVVLLDLSLPDSQGFDTFTKFRAQAPAVPVIVLTGLDDEELALRAVREGAQDYLVKGNATCQSLARSVRFAVERNKTKGPEAARRPEPGRVLGFLGVKGGVGTTTIVLNTAAILARQKKSVIALELRSYGGSFGSQTLQDPSRNLKQLLDLEPERITPAEIRKCLVSLPSGAQAIYAPQKAEEFMEIPPSQAEAIIRCAALEADYVLVDLPAQACYPTQAAVRHCDLLTLVVERDAAGVTAGRQAVQLLRHWGVEKSSVAAVIVIKDALAGFISPVDMASRLGCPIIGVIPPATELCAASARAGTPFALMQPDSIAATSLVDMVDKLASRTSAPMTV